MASIWGLFQNYNTGFFSSNAWIRPGHFSGSSFAWDHDPILVPEQFTAYYPDPVFTGHLSVDPYNDRWIWVYGVTNISGHFHARVWVYDRILEIWHDLFDVDGGTTDFPICVDMAFDVDDTMFMAIGNAGATGLGAGVPTGQGVYMCHARGAFTAAGSGHEHGFNSGNVNNPHTLTALDLAPTTEEGGRILYTAHSLTRINGLQATGWVTSSSADDGATWHDPVPTYNGNQFRIEVLTVMRLWSGGGGLWYCSDNSGTGAYSTSNLSATIAGTPADGPTGGYGAGIFDSGSIAFPFADGTHAVAFPTQIATTLNLYGSADGGATWTGHTQGLEHKGFWYRGGRAARTGLDAAGVSRDNPSHNSEIWWTEDGGTTWHGALAEETAIGLSLDFGEFVPAPATVYLETLTFRDARMFVGQSRYYIAGATETEAHDNAEGLANLLDVLSNGLMTGTVGPYSSPPVAPGPGVPEVYQNIETVIRLTWITADGVAIGIDVPAPLSELFIDDQESYVLLSPFITDVAAGAITYKLCTRGGQLAVSFVGATRVMRGFRSTQSIRTLDPSETSTAE